MHWSMISFSLLHIKSGQCFHATDSKLIDSFENQNNYEMIIDVLKWKVLAVAAGIKHVSLPYQHTLHQKWKLRFWSHFLILAFSQSCWFGQ